MCSVLRASSSLIGLGSFIFAARRRWADAALLGACAVVSQLFWRRGERGGALHAVDAALAKATVAHFVLKTRMSKPYAGVLCCVALSAWGSDVASGRGWLSRAHVARHTCLHVSCFVASLFALR